MLAHGHSDDMTQPATRSLRRRRSDAGCGVSVDHTLPSSQPMTLARRLFRARTLDGLTVYVWNITAWAAMESVQGSYMAEPALRILRDRPFHFQQAVRMPQHLTEPVEPAETGASDARIESLF